MDRDDVVEKVFYVLATIAIILTLIMIAMLLNSIATKTRLHQKMNSTLTKEEILSYNITEVENRQIDKLSESIESFSKNEKIKLHTLFSILINQSLIVVDYSEETLTSEDKHQIKELILSKSNNENIVILDTILNQYNDIADYILVISDNVKSYYGSIDDVLIIRSLVAVSISNHHNLENILKDYQYTVDDEGEVVIREEVLEEVLFELLKNNIDVYQIRNLGEKIKLYQGKGEEL